MNSASMAGSSSELLQILTLKARFARSADGGLQKIKGTRNAANVHGPESMRSMIDRYTLDYKQVARQVRGFSEERTEDLET